MARLLITFVSSLAAVASLSLSPAYAQSRGAHGTPPSTPAAKPAPMTVAERIDAHPQLVARLTPLLPTGVTLDAAAKDFKNQGQFIAALHVARNLNIPFDKLKTEMTGADHDSLGKAIRDLQPTANAKAEAKRAEAQADADLRAAGTRKNTDADKDGK